MSRIINLTSVIPEPVIIRYGNLELDVTGIPAYYALKFMDFDERRKAGTATGKEAVDIVLSALQEKNPNVTEDDILKAGSFSDLFRLISTVTTEIISVTTEESGPLAETGPMQ